MKYAMVLVLFQLMILSGFSQTKKISNATGEALEWNEYYQLQWSDFGGVRPKHAAGDAGTAVQIKATPFVVQEEVNYEVKALFIRTKSWSAAQTEALLAHESLHFDIAELYARKIRQRIAELKEQGVRRIQVYNLAIQELLEESNQLDMQYDIETLHGAMQKKQTEWSEKVAADLSALKAFKKKKRVVTAG